MTTPTKGPIMTDLISRLEALEGPSREVDAEIAQLVGERHGRKELVHIESRSYTVIEECAPKYTASIDVAMSLVPEGWSYLLGNWHGAETVLAHLQSGGGVSLYWYEGDCGGKKYSQDTAKTAPIAICIAALKARQS